MSNPLFQQMSQVPAGNNIFQRFQQFRQMFQGDPRAQVQHLLNSGRVSQAQYNQAVQIAQQMQKMMGR